MSKKATHKGTCQACGRLQKLPNGVLSQHGYNLDCGFFSGVCWGANHLPLEEDRTILDRTILHLRESAKAARENDPASVICEVAQTSRYVGRRKVTEGGVVGFSNFEEFNKLVRENEGYWMTVGWKRLNKYLPTSLDEQRETTIRKEFKAAQNKAVVTANRSADKADQLADGLVSLLNEVHGKPLKEL